MQSANRTPYPQALTTPRRRSLVRLPSFVIVICKPPLKTIVFLILLGGKMGILKVPSISSCCSTRFNTRNFYPTSLFSASSINSCSRISYPCSKFSTPRGTRRNRRTLILSKSASEETEVSTDEDEWLKNLPDKKKPLYSHSLPCVEAWLKQLGFFQSNDDRAVWFIEKPDWHAKLSLDVTDLYIRYVKSGPGNLDKDVERRFSYALSREDIENAILGGP
ncbi:uncharacterized protein LOC112509583 [Cynara cardunculus var. scolymus]|uniref:Uncharacterized protein n=1 Tax=Cynara cardunculus var. scolymus TaxID=59895 RepID=A0A118K475_CYNCS|nr:uncharacterized protein LOC112509583 [Cynara cardunculus var. scolymus]KVI07111.1 Protein of unknown function DUF3143 [Cynara cardunculus var. scolymus]